MPGLESLISHRFRGFAPQENTVEGLIAALNAGVLNLEFDIRIAKCGTPVIYHDEHAKAGNGRKHLLKDVMVADFTALGGTFKKIPTAESLFQVANAHSFKKAKFLVDIKDAGFEIEIFALINMYHLQNRVVYVSWLPEVLYAMHDLAPTTPLCLSHWCKKPGNLIRARHTVYVAKDGYIPRENNGYVHGKRSGWYVEGGLKGELRSMIIKTGGSVCVPQNMVTRELVDDYHQDGIEVSTFSYVTWSKINDHKKRFNIDFYFIDNKSVFAELEI